MRRPSNVLCQSVIAATGVPILDQIVTRCPIDEVAVEVPLQIRNRH
jgi:hypothetical protein